MAAEAILPSQGAPRAILDFLTSGAFPEREDVVSSELSTETSAQTLKLIADSKKQAEAELGALSRNSTSDIDGWIAQAKRLHEDIERSRLTAREIVCKHEEGSAYRNKVYDASRKVDLLKGEIALNETLTRKIESIRELHDEAAVVEDAISQGKPVDAMKALRDMEGKMLELQLPSGSAVISVLEEVTLTLSKRIEDLVKTQWSDLVEASAQKGVICVHGTQTALDELLSVAAQLQSLDHIVEVLRLELLGLLQKALLSEEPPYHVVSVDDNGIQLQQIERAGNLNVHMESILLTFQYLRDHLPHQLSSRLLTECSPLVVSTLLSSKFSRIVPTAIADFESFQVLVNEIRNFSDRLAAMKCPGSVDINDWIENIPGEWLSQRRAHCLDHVRDILLLATGESREVEHVETQTVRDKGAEKADASAETADDWDASWEDNDAEEPQPQVETAADSSTDNDEVAAWGLDDDEELGEDADATASKRDKVPKDEKSEEEEDAWGWGDEDSGMDVQEQPSDKDTTVQKEVTLKESYNVTTTPDAILDIVVRQILDARSLKTERYSHLSIRESGSGLLTLPTLILAMFRAMAPFLYTQKLTAGNMYLYNDCIYLSRQLKALAGKHSQPRLEADADEIERFAKLSYGKEMQSQRTILSDMLAGSQGFANCSSPAVMRDAENAVRAIVDRNQAAYADWQRVLSKSALLQSVGSLIATVVDKMIVSIEDLSDISADDSQCLVKLCNYISELEDIFLPEGASEEDRRNGTVVPVTTVYVPRWLKFQYLVNILDSSLADIKYLWTEGELSLEFSQEEVVDLIEALFADSEYRRKAIGEIKRSRR